MVHRVKDIVVPPSEVTFPARAAGERNTRELSCPIATPPLPPAVDNGEGEAHGPGYETVAQAPGLRTYKPTNDDMFYPREGISRAPTDPDGD